jgi:predicted amidohydrolase YtcJ
MNFNVRLTLFLCLATSACLNAQMFVDTVLVHGRIWTENSQQPEAEALAIFGNRIVGVGSSADMLKLSGPSTKVIELDGRRVVPGFNDSHVHLTDGGAGLASVQLRDTTTQAEFRDRIAAFARAQPRGAWIQNGDWDHERWTPAQLPTHQLIDDVTPDNPVFVSRLDGHMSLGNALAMKLAGITRDTKDIPGGVIVRDAQGNPTGIFKDAALGLIEKAIPPPNSRELRIAVEAAEKYAAANGVTSVQDMSAAPDSLRVYEQLLHEGKLQIRISGHQPLPTWKRLAATGILANFGSDLLHIGGLKGFADGSLGSTTAWFFKPYLDAPEHQRHRQR